MASGIRIWERSVSPSGVFALPRQEQTIGEAFGGGLASFGEALDHYASQQAEIGRIVAQRDGAAWIGQSKPQAILALNPRIKALEDSAPEGAFGHVQAVEKAFDDYETQVLAGAPNDDARDEMQAYLETLKAGYLDQAGDFEKASSLALRAKNIDQAGRYWGDVVVSDPRQYEAAVAAMRDTIGAQDLSPDKAAAYTDQVTRSLGAVAADAEAQSDPGGFLKKVADGGWNGKVDPERLLQAKGDAERALKAQQIRQQQQQVIEQQKRQADFDWRYGQTMPLLEGGEQPDAAGKIGGVVVPTPQDALAAHPGEQGQAIARSIDTAKQIGLDHQTIWSGTKADDDRLLDSIKPVAGQASTAEQQERYVKALAQVTEKRNLLKTDPATAAARINPAVAAAWQALVQTQQDVAAGKASPANLVVAARQAVALSQAEQERQGVPADKMRTLPQSLINPFKKVIAEGKPEEVADTVDEASALFGPDGIRDLVAAGAPQSIVPLAAANTLADAPWRAALVRTLRVPEKDLEDQARAKGGFTRYDLDDTIQDIDPALLRALPANYVDAVMRVGLEHGTAGFSLADSARFAVDSFLQSYTFHANAVGGGAFMVPKQFTDGRVMRGLTAIVQHIDRYVTLAPEDDRSDNPVSADDPAYRVQQQAARIKSGAYGWINNKSNDGVRLVYETGDPVLQLGADGKSYPVEVKFSLAQAIELAPAVHGMAI